MSKSTVRFSNTAGRPIEGLDPTRPFPVVVVASGYFNPLHIGHIRYLEAAKKLGDFLVVIVNNDAQVQLKGSKPFLDGRERVELVRALRCVDVALLSIDKNRSVGETLHAVGADIFANGGDCFDFICVHPDELSACRSHNAILAFGVGGNEKLNSSSKLLKNS